VGCRQRSLADAKEGLVPHFSSPDVVDDLIGHPCRRGAVHDYTREANAPTRSVVRRHRAAEGVRFNLRVGDQVKGGGHFKDTWGCIPEMGPTKASRCCSCCLDPSRVRLPKSSVELAPN
jgi:hypothetical protein